MGTMMSDLFECTGPSEVLASRQHQSGLHAVGDPHLGAVDDVVAAVLCVPWS